MNDLNYIIKEITQDVEGCLQNGGIYYRLFARQKSGESIKRKLEKKATEYRSKGKKMQDLIGIRLVFYFLEDVELVHQFFKEHFPGYEETSTTKDDIAKAEEQVFSLNGLADKIFMPTRLNMIIRMNEQCTKWLKLALESESEVDTSLIDNTYEVQLRTVLSEGWHEVEHDLRYKTQDESWWDECDEEARMLNGIYATLETAERSMGQIFSTIAHKNYKGRAWSAMLRNHFKIRTMDNELSEGVLKAIEERKLAKGIYRTDRSLLVKRMLALSNRYPLKLDNIVFFANRISDELNDGQLIELEPAPIKMLLDKELEGIR